MKQMSMMFIITREEKSRRWLCEYVEIQIGSAERAQWVKLLVAKLSDPSLIPGTYMVE